MSSEESNLSSFVKYNRRESKLTQEELAAKAGVGLRFIRELEQGKESLRMDKVNQVLQLFGYSLSPQNDRVLDPFYVHRHHLNRNVQIVLKNRTTLIGFIIGDILKHNVITAWKFVSNNDAKAYRKTNDDQLIRIINNADIDSIQSIDA